jgi:hypothetical protein
MKLLLLEMDLDNLLVCEEIIACKREREGERERERERRRRRRRRDSSSNTP